MTKLQILKVMLFQLLLLCMKTVHLHFITKKPPVAEMIKKAIGKEKGGQKPGREKHATLTMDQARKIAEDKLEDLNTEDVEMGARIVAGTARSMGIAVE